MDFQTWLGKTPEGKKAAAADASEHVADRLAIGEKIAELGEALATDVRPAQKLVEKELAAFEKAKKGQVAAELKLRRAQLDEHNLRTRAETEINQHEQRLRAGAIAGIAVFLNELAGLWDGERKHWPWSHRDQPGSAGERIAQIRAIEEQATALLFTPDPEEAESELAKLKSSIVLEATAAA